MKVTIDKEPSELAYLTGSDQRVLVLLQQIWLFPDDLVPEWQETQPGAHLGAGTAFGRFGGGCRDVWAAPAASASSCARAASSKAMNPPGGRLHRIAPTAQMPWFCQISTERSPSAATACAATTIPALGDADILRTLGFEHDLVVMERGGVGGDRVQHPLEGRTHVLAWIEVGVGDADDAGAGALERVVIRHAREVGPSPRPRSRPPPGLTSSRSDARICAKGIPIGLYQKWSGRIGVAGGEMAGQPRPRTRSGPNRRNAAASRSLRCCRSAAGGESGGRELPEWRVAVARHGVDCRGAAFERAHAGLSIAGANRLGGRARPRWDRSVVP